MPGLAGQVRAGRVDTVSEGSRLPGFVRSCFGELDADLIGFWGAELGVEGEGFLPMVMGLTRVVVGVVTVREAVVGSGLLVFVAELAGQA
jgi:hypothetical protein